MQGDGSRYLFALGRDRVLPRRLAAVHRRLQSPHVAVLTLGSFSRMALSMIAGSGIEAVDAYAMLTEPGSTSSSPLITTSVAIVVCFWRHPHRRPGIWVAAIAPVTSAVALVALFVVTTLKLQILTATPVGALIAVVTLIVVASAGCLAAVYLKHARPGSYSTIGNQ